MLRIRKEHKKRFYERELRAFEESMLGHLRDLFPDKYATQDEQSVRALVQAGIAKAAKYGIRSERGVCIFIDAMFALGEKFDEDSQLPWAREILTDKSIDGELLRADELKDALIEHLDEDADEAKESDEEDAV